MPDKPLFVLRGEIRTPPMGVGARQLAGFYLREVQQGVALTMPVSRPLPQIQHGCHELRIQDAANRLTWRIIYYIDDSAILVLGVFEKKTQKLPENEKEVCRQTLQRYFAARRQGEQGNG